MVVVVRGRLLPDAWEKSILEVWKKGIVIDTEYGERSKDIAVVIRVERPLEEPRVHLKGIVAGRLSGLFEYVDEVIKGIHDNLIEVYGYTYHERLFRYEGQNGIVDQIEYIIRKLKEAPYSRRAQAITWQPWKDIHSEHPPCLQRIWCRVIDGKLVMHVHMRSNDAMKASFMNMFAFTELQRYIAERLGVEVGYYLHIADSYHIYENDWKWAEKFVEQIKTGRSKKYWWRTEDITKRIAHTF
ncbi:MAG: thymidylate synthase [Thermoprotei archaeon]|nr:MAG: thymidylate synthase [Thermoprotei archaeon]